MTSSGGRVLMCYYGSWAHYRRDAGKVSVEDLDPNLCTHIIYSFVGINGEGDVTILDQWLDIDLKGFEKFVNLKKINPNVKLLVAIGGWNQGASNFSKVAGNLQLRTKFVSNAVEFVKKYGFDGFDIDWEYPADPERGGRSEDKQNFIELLKELRKAFDSNNLILTAAVGCTKSRREISYNVSEMAKYLDFINIMVYDLHGSWDRKTGENAPLYGSSEGDTLNVNTIVNEWIAQPGIDSRKLILGISFYGRSFTLENASNNKVGAPSNGGGNPGPYTQESGSLSYLEICENIKRNGWTSVWNEKQQVPYAYKDNQWVGYDNLKSLEMKVDLAKKYNLGGVMVWSIEQDDVHNHIGDGRYPLLTGVKKRLQ